MSDITLKADTNPIDEYTQFYEFMSQQILAEVDRRLTMLKITNDTSPIKAEEFLTECIATTFSRFGVCDVQMRVAYGYIAGSIYAISSFADEAKDLIQPQFPYDIEIHPTNSSYHRYTYDRTFEDDITKWAAVPVCQWELAEVHDDSFTSNSATIENMRDQGLRYLQDKVNEIAAPTRRKYGEIGLGVIPYSITRTMADTPYLRNMNITAHDTTIMLYQDLFPQVIEMVRNGSIN